MINDPRLFCKIFTKKFHLSPHLMSNSCNFDSPLPSHHKRLHVDMSPIRMKFQMDDEEVGTIKRCSSPMKSKKEKGFSKRQKCSGFLNETHKKDRYFSNNTDEQENEDGYCTPINCPVPDFEYEMEEFYVHAKSLKATVINHHLCCENKGRVAYHKVGIMNCFPYMPSFLLMQGIDPSLPKGYYCCKNVLDASKPKQTLGVKIGKPLTVLTAIVNNDSYLCTKLLIGSNHMVVNGPLGQLGVIDIECSETLSYISNQLKEGNIDKLFHLSLWQADFILLCR